MRCDPWSPACPRLRCDRWARAAVPSFTRTGTTVHGRLCRGPYQRRQPQMSLHRRRVLPVLRGHRVVDGDRMSRFRYYEPRCTSSHSSPTDTDADTADAAFLQDRLHQQVPGLHAGGGPTVIEALCRIHAVAQKRRSGLKYEPGPEHPRLPVLSPSQQLCPVRSPS